MSTDLIVSGPFEIPFTVSAAKVKRIETSHVKAFWLKAETARFHKKQGVYIFATRAGKGFRPVYVGKSSKGFKSECFTPHKLLHYAHDLSNGRRGSPVMFFIAPTGNVNKVPAKAIGEIEDLMIQFAVAKNPDLRNKVGTAAADWSIKGVVRGGKGSKSQTAAAFTTMMGITKGIAT